MGVRFNVPVVALPGTTAFYERKLAIMNKILLFAGVVFFALPGFSQMNDAIETNSTELPKELSAATGRKSDVRLKTVLNKVEPVLVESWTENRDRKNNIVTLYSTGGNKLAEASFKNLHLFGEWASYYTNTQPRDSGNFARNIPDGEWRTWYPNGNLRTIRHYNASKLGMMKNQLNNRNPKLEFYPLAMAAHKDRSYFEHRTSARYSFKSIPASGDSYDAPFAECLHDGLYMNFFPNGAVKDSGYYKDGLRDGVWVEWNDNQTVRTTGFYINGEKHSGWKQESADGKLLRLMEYKDGVLLHSKNYQD